jgi:3-oxoacyl-[acyl-carrier protein] reductase
VFVSPVILKKQRIISLTMDRRTALVTGASRGIGRAVAVALAGSGCHVLINYRTRQREAEETLAIIHRDGKTGELCPFDVADTAACEAAVARAFGANQRIDILVNNAGVRHEGLLVFMKPEDWGQVVNTNLNGFYNVTRQVVKQMALNRWGRIVSIASTAGQTGVAGQVNYSAAKAGIIGASKALAKEVAKRGVTVNVLAPGFIETEMLDGLQRDQILPQIPAGRFGKPEEVAAAAVFLCSDAAAYINGAVLNINGGVFT